MRILYDPEVWLPVPGRPREASTHGRVRTLDRFVVTKRGVVKFHRSHVCKPTMNKPGYQMISIGGRPIAVHRCVALAFCAGYSHGLHVNHKDGKKLNNRPENLEWITNKENVLHARYVLGVYKDHDEKQRGANNPSARAIEGFDSTGKVIRSYQCISDGARDGLNSSELYASIKSNYRLHRGLRWRYA